MMDFAHIMAQPAMVFAVTLVLASLLITCLTDISFSLGLVDLPGGRKKHKKVVPLVGGIAILGSVSLTLVSYIFMNGTLLAFWLASLLLTGICVLDDKRPLPSNVRFFIQFVSLVVIIFLGKTVIFNLGDLLGLGPISLGLFSIPFTCFALIGIINAVNMMDGVDGLTGGVSIVELGVLFFLAQKQGATQDALLIAAFMGAILGFLIFNFPSPFADKRKVFLGDAGSMLIGLTLGWLCVRLTQMPNGYSPALMLWVMALPLMDTIHLIINRKARGVSAFRADRRHMHHILLQLNYSAKQTSLIMMNASFFLSAIGVFLYFNGAPDWMLLTGIIILFLIYSVFSYGLKKRVAARKYKFFGNVTNE